MMNKSIFCLIVAVVFSLQLAFAGEYFLKQTLFEGDTTEYTVGSYVYKVTLVAVFDSQLKAQFEINGETTGALSEDESEKLSDGARIQVREILPQESGDGKDLVQFNFFPVAHPEAAQEQEVVVAAEPEPSVISANDPAEQPEKEMRVAPEQEAKVDITRTKPTNSWWESLIDWLKGLFS
jgi:hypothetical protein